MAKFLHEMASHVRLEAVAGEELTAEQVNALAQLKIAENLEKLVQVLALMADNQRN